MKRKFKSILTLNNGAAAPPAPPAENTIDKIVFNFSPGGIVRNETLEGKDYVVAPMVMLVEGVHNGSNGPLYYPREELEKSPAVWNHKPVVVYHPEMNGVGVSACDPAIVNSRRVGYIFNTRCENGRLKAEAWIDKDKAAKVDMRIVEALEENKMMELSTGVFTTHEQNEGEWNGEAYTAIARDYKADHLALLPDKIGACSIEDGAGFLRNEEKRQIQKHGKGAINKIFNSILERCGLTDNEMSHDNIRTQLSNLLQERFGSDNEFIFVEDVFPNFVIFERDSKFWRLNYTTNETEVQLSEEQPEEVVRVTEYRTVEGDFVGNNQTKQTSNTKPNKAMTKEERKTIVDSLVGNDAGWSESDREFLMGLEDDHLNKVKATADASGGDGEGGGDDDDAAGDGNATPPAQNANTPPTGNTQGTQSVDEFISNAPPEYRDMLSSGLEAHRKERAKLIETITANKQNVFKKEQLEKKGTDELRGLASLASARPVNYSGQGGESPETNASGGEYDEEPLPAPTMNFETAEK